MHDVQEMSAYLADCARLKGKNNKQYSIFGI
jgi:hypothetical protein